MNRQTVDSDIVISACNLFRQVPESVIKVRREKR